MIRTEDLDDLTAIERVHTLAFGRPDEAVLVNTLRDAGGLLVSMVTVINEEVVGHIAYSPITFDQQAVSAKAVGLGPLAVLPEFQRIGHGLRLVEASLQACRQAGAEIVIVLGHPEYYSKAGFKRASTFGIYCEFDVPEEAFMVIEIRKGALAKYRGIAHYHPAFQEVG